MTSENNDTVSINLKFENGSIGSINYFSNGSRNYPKENLQIYCDGKILQLNNFKNLKGYGWKNFSSINLWNQDKGQKKCIENFIYSIKNKQTVPISYEDIIHTTKVSIEIEDSSMRYELLKKDTA